MTTSSIANFTDTATGWQRAFYAFLAEKKQRSGSRRTVEDYSRMLQDFFGRSGKRPDKVTSQDIFVYAHSPGLSGKQPSMVKAYNGQMYKLPVAGDIADRNSKPLAGNTTANDNKPMTDSKSATDNKIEDKGKTTGNRNTHALILTVIGIILFILGILIVSIHGAPLRGSGVGTIAIIAGIILLIIAYLRFRSTRAK
jgi:uncharacterized membrane protein